MSLLTVFATGKAAYDLLDPLLGKLLNKLGWKKDDKRRAEISRRMRDLVREAREVVASTPPDKAGGRLQAIVDRLRDDLMRDGVPREEALIFTDQASAVLVMAAFGSIEEWFALRTRLSVIEQSLGAQEKSLRELQSLLDQSNARQRHLQALAIIGMTLAFCAIVLALLVVFRR